MNDKPTPMRRPDPRLSNLVLEGGRQKAYPPPPPPVPDMPAYIELREGFDPLTAVIVAILLVALVGIVVWMVALGCDPLRCP